jgi:anti-sigma regulatory factor (Ser/Thr protein kinase)
MAISKSSAPTIASSARPRQSLRLRVAGGPFAPARARAWLQSGAGWLPKELEANLLLLVSELVNNSVLHGRAGEQDVIEIEVHATPGGVLAQVSDTGPGFVPQERRGETDEPGGWGLVLVEQLAQRWGVDSNERTSVWFELARA